MRKCLFCTSELERYIDNWFKKEWIKLEIFSKYHQMATICYIIVLVLVSAWYWSSTKLSTDFLLSSVTVRIPAEMAIQEKSLQPEMSYWSIKRPFSSLIQDIKIASNYMNKTVLFYLGFGFSNLIWGGHADHWFSIMYTCLSALCSRCYCQRHIILINFMFGLSKPLKSWILVIKKD